MRTDLALEAADEEETARLSEDDYLKHTEDENGVVVTVIDIKSQRAQEAIGKPPGRYITVEVPPLSDDETMLEEQANRIARHLREMLPPRGCVLVVGLGNAAVTPDALGPKTAGMILATRHIEAEFARTVGLDDLRAAAVMTPGVLGRTGVESGEMVKGVCDCIQPVAVIAVDALAARSMARLGCTVQMCDTGISPGSGVGNNRQPLNYELLEVPVIGIGVPTVVDASIIAKELGGEAGLERGMMVTPREIDLIIARASRLTAMAINGALQPSYSPLELITVAKC